MTGFQLGTPGGAQLGGSGGGTLGLPPTDWTLDGRELIDSRPLDETATLETLTLTWRVTSPAAVAAFREFKPSQGKVDVLPTDDGGFTAVDRAGGANTLTLDPPHRRKPLRLDRTVHVGRYEESLVSQTLDEWDIEIEFVFDGDRTDTPGLEQTPAADEWGLDTPRGQIATGRVDAEVLGTGDEGVRRFDLTTRLTQAQAHVFETAYPRLRGGRVRVIPDEANLAVDGLGGEVTIDVNAPDGQDAVPDGEYVVREWESERLTDRYQSVSVVIAEKA